MLVGLQRPECVDKHVRVERVFALGARHRLPNPVDFNTLQGRRPVDQLLSENDHVESRFNGGRGRLRAEYFLPCLDLPLRKPKGTGNLLLISVQPPWLAFTLMVSWWRANITECNPTR
jgi:hypothetical protein